MPTIAMATDIAEYGPGQRDFTISHCPYGSYEIINILGHRIKNQYVK